MTTKVKPTVEGWEREFDEKFGDPDAIPAKNAYGDDVYYKYHIEYMPDSLIKDFIRHSLQEAKAEGFREGYERGKRESHPIHRVSGN